MKESFISRALENLKATELLFENELYNASTNRAYYAAFHIAVAAIYAIGITPNMDHRVIQTLFTDNYFNKRKILSSKYKRYLNELQNNRNLADYRDGINKKTSKKQLLDSKEFVTLVLKEINNEY
jgi:uncharacterized protein (UPF0332 family)